MAVQAKLKKRGFVMTGGGAKGLYEAGVIHAFHVSGMEFDVITGSSIGAMNSIFFAEYLFFKRQLPPEVLQDPAQAVEAMDARVKAYHHAWLQMPDKRVIDDSQEGPIGQLKDDLEHLDADLPLLVRLAWWWSDPDRAAAPPPQVWPALTRLGAELIVHLGGMEELLRLLKLNRGELFEKAARDYLKRFGLEHSLVPPNQDHKLKDIFTQPVSPLRLEHLTGNVSAPDEPGTPKYSLVDPARSLREYDLQGITVRLTRANYRTGRLEMSTHTPPENFVRFMDKQAWRLQADDPDKIPLGSFRLQVPGNPNAINAALCSGRFPGVFSPYPVSDIYPASDPENALLYQMLANWLCDPAVETTLQQAYQSVWPGGQERFAALFNGWRESQAMRGFFPQAGDVYIDGGAIDNTPSNSAVDFVKEWAERSGYSKRDVELELFVIFLDVEPKSKPVQVKDPAIFEVVSRTLEIQGAANRSSDANTVETINSFGQRSEDLAVALKAVLDNVAAVMPGLSAGQQQQLEQRLFAEAKNLPIHVYLGDAPGGIVQRLNQWVDEVMAKSLPVQVEEIKIYPEVMPLSTLQFTARLGYQKENAIKMLTSGCYDTLWTLRRRLEGQKLAEFDAQDQQTLGLLRKWMDIEAWPGAVGEQETLRQQWQCRRTACVFHAQHCQHGAHSGQQQGGSTASLL